MALSKGGKGKIKTLKNFKPLLLLLNATPNADLFF